MNNYKYNPIKMTPFKWFVLENFPFIEEDFDSLTSYGLWCKLKEYFDKVKNKTNEVGSQVENLTNAFIQLENYVDNYFKNLDVQDEINNKLDEMTENGDLEVIIGKYINDKVKLIFPKFWDNVLSGDCNLILYNNKNILIDTHYAGAWDYVKSMLIDNNILSIDYLIISHYHADHIGNLENLINHGYVNSQTIIYLPADTPYLDGTNGTENVNLKMEQTKALLDLHNINYIVPSENEKLVIKNLIINFFNCDGEELRNYYYNHGIKDYNQYSTINLIEHKNLKYLYAGDAGPNTYQRLIDTNYIKGKMDLFKIGHHCHNTSTNVEFMNLIQPNFSIQSSGAKDFIQNNFSITSDIPILKNNGSKIYPTNMQKDYLTFEDDGEHINCVKGYEYELSNNLETKKLYVNINADTHVIQDGSQQKPFTEIMQALGFIKTFPQYNYLIYISPGSYGLAHPSDSKKRRIYVTTGINSLVRLIGTGENPEDVKISNLIINNSSVILQNLCVDVDKISSHEAINIFNSNVTFNDIKIKSTTNITKAESVGISSNWNSNLKINNIFIDNVEDGIKLTHSNLTANEIEYGENISHELLIPYNSHIITKTITINNENQNSAFTQNYKQTKTPSLLFNNSNGSTGVIPLNKPSSLFDWIEIYYSSDNEIRGNTGKIYSPLNKSVGLGIFYTHSVGDVYNKQQMAIIHENDITLTETGTQIAITSDGVTKTNPETPIKILKVIGGFNEY